MFSIKFKTENSINLFVVDFDFKEESNCYYNMIMSDNKNYIYYPGNVKGNFSYQYEFDKVFKYNVKLLQFDGEIIKLIDEKNFNIKNHNFTIILKSEIMKDLEIWNDYLMMVEARLGVKFNITNGYSQKNTKDAVEISRASYDNFLKKSIKPLTNDYSSLTIIKSLFDIL